MLTNAETSSLAPGETGCRALLEARQLSKAFPGVCALDRIDFDVRPGELHALVGENGAGKSTLVRILSGEIHAYDGEIRLDGAATRFASPREAIHAGIAAIPQELQLVSTMDVAENILLGREPLTAGVLVDADALAQKAAASLELLGEPGNLVREPLVHLPAAKRQMVAIARALSLDARLIFMDEPTSSMGPSEVACLERVIGRLLERGVAIVYISHRLDEVRRLAHRVTVLRDGRHVATLPARDVTEDGLVRLMVGRTIERPSLVPPPAGAEVLLRVENLSLEDSERPDGYRLRDISLTVRRGEIVGLGGLIGAGRTDFLLAIAGALERRISGRIWLAGRPFHAETPADARTAGVMLLPEERKAQAVFPHLTVDTNLTLSALARVSTFGWIDRDEERRASDTLLDRTRARVPSPSTPIGTLSGGNQQKVVLARCLFASPSLLLLDEPTRGIDLAAKADIHLLLRELASQGCGILWCSSELPELLSQCHRVVVFREGRVAANLAHADASEERILSAAAGTSALAERQEASGSTSGGGSVPPSEVPPVKSPRRPRTWSGLVGLAAVVLLAIVSSPVRNGQPVFLDVGNLTDILRQVAEKGILAVGMTPVIISGGIDLSVGSVLALSATLTGWMLMHGSIGLPGTIAVVLLVGALAGALNGAIISRWRVQPFIVTLATMSAMRGVARYVSGGAAIPIGFGAGGAPETFRAIGGTIGGFISVPAVLLMASVLMVHVLLSRVSHGRYLYAIGDNETAAVLSGVRVSWHKASVYVLSAVLASVAGIVHCAQLEQGNPNDGIAYELDAIAAVVIGGTSLSGGAGTVAGTLVGILMIGVINNALGLNNVDANLQLILKGAIIVGAVLLQQKRR